MVFSIATTFEESIIEEFSKINNRIKDDKFKITETFGAMVTKFGSGRNAFRLPKINDNKLKRYIDYSHYKGFNFNYLLNSTCLSGKETSKEFIINLCNHINKLSNIGVDIFTIANPFLIDIISHNFEGIKINTSINSRINTLEEIRRYIDLGVNRLTIHYDLNRDFKLIKKITETENVELELLANNPCLHYCIYANNHMNLDSHSSTNSENISNNTLLPTFNCKHTRLKYPQEIIKSRWIRPIDVDTYYGFGVNIIKIAGRNMPQEWLINAAKYYTEKIDFPQFYSKLIERGKWNYVLREDKSLDKLDINVNLPKTFLDWFISDNCKSDCEECRHCEYLAKKYIEFISDDLRNKYIKESERILKKEFAR